MSDRKMANRPCDDDYEALYEVFDRLEGDYGHKNVKLDSAVLFMLYAAISQLNKNFVIFTRDYQSVNDVLGIELAKHADVVINVDESYIKQAASYGEE